MNAIADNLTREVGGLPVYGWAAIVGGGIFVGRKLAGGGLFGGRSSAPAGVPFIDPNTTGYTATGEPASSGGVNLTATTYTDNRAWRRAAVDYLTAAGVGAVAAERAIGRYLQGIELDATDVAIVQTAIRHLGNPPESVPVPTTQPDAPVPSNPVTVRAPRSTTVTRTSDGDGETANEVAARIRGPWLQTPTTTDGRPLTGGYLVALNGLNTWATRPLRIGTRIIY